jgi:hypothetical protein
VIKVNSQRQESTDRSIDWVALGVYTSSLTADLHVPIAAESLEAIESYVGRIEKAVRGRVRPINALVIEATRPPRDGRVPLWGSPEADQFYERLHPEKQLWVHVDYGGYRAAWKRLGFGELSRNIFLDHLRNRAVVRISGYRHPFIRLCPVSRDTNTNSGLNIGVEGIEKANIKKLAEFPDYIRIPMEEALAAPIVLADPFDLTKMLDIPPGLSEMQGTAQMLKKFYRAK